MAAKARLLVAEDSATQAAQEQMFLQQAGYSVMVAKHGLEALEMVRAEPPDLVVTDLEMPEMTGLELVESLHREFPNLPTVLITARGSEDIAAQALSKGAASYVPKKFLETDLIPTLNRILNVLEASRSTERLGRYMESTETEFRLENDDSLVPFVIARFLDDLRHLQLFDENELIQVGTALDEALVNAIIHGNLEVSSDLRSIDNGIPYRTKIEQRQQESPFQERRVFVASSSTRTKVQFVIRDEGPGFDPRDVPDPTDPANLEKVSGRGLMLINAFMSEVRHNDQGNEITMIKCKTTQDDE